MEATQVDGSGGDAEGPGYVGLVSVVVLLGDLRG